MSDSNFSFEISLSVLNHLGRNLYRNFITVLGEAISNSWDADAKNVWLEIDRKKNTLVIKDDGTGMNVDEFQNKFLKIGYSKRKGGVIVSPTGRPYIGRKGIGKLALLSCAKKISIITKNDGGQYIGGVIDNSELDKAIINDLIPQEYPLGSVDNKLFDAYTKNHKSGTIIFFEDINEGIKNSIEYIQRLIALYFRFSLLDNNFNIFVNNKKITIEDLAFLAQETQFLWRINKLSDPFVNILLSDKVYSNKVIPTNFPVNGFIASVKKPSNLKIPGTDEKVSLDLFVNGRLREKDILKHIPSTRVVESYLYGQIHFNGLDDSIDRFASSREGIIANDPKLESFLDNLRTILSIILSDWDLLRRGINQDGDPDNPSITKKERKSRELFTAVADEYEVSDDSDKKRLVESWVNSLGNDAQFNFSSYAECFISENLVRKFIEEKQIPLSKEADDEYSKRVRNETDSKNRGNISIDVRQNNNKLSYLSLDHLATLVDKVDGYTEAGLSRDSREYKPIRDALAHTALLTDAAKIKLSSVFENIKSRVKTLIST